MRIYVSHSRHFDYKNDLYEPIKNAPFFGDHTFIFPYDDKEMPFNTKQLFIEKGCDLVLAEVSYPSTGQGIELGWAEDNQIPVACLYKKGQDISQSLSFVSTKFLSYTNPEDMIGDINTIIHSL
jgi:hypothetical protein